MSKLFKEMFDKHLNKEKNYQNIITKIERNNRMKIKNISYTLVPICLLLVIGFSVFFIQKRELKPIMEGPNHKIYINEGEEIATSLDADLKKIDGKVLENDNWNFTFIKNLEIIEKYNDIHFYEIYVKENKESKEYSILHDYIIEADNITIAFSKIGKPLRDYYFGENLRKSIINNTEVIISKHKDNYIAEFSYGGINFDIEMGNTTIDKVVELLDTIIR